MDKIYINADSKYVGSTVLYAASALRGKLFLDAALTKAADANTVEELFMSGTLCVNPDGTSDLIRVSGYAYDSDHDSAFVCGIDSTGNSETFHTGDPVTDDSHTT